MRITSWKYRAQVPGFEFPESIRVRQAAYDERSARMLEEMADRIEGHRLGMAGGFDSAELLNRTIEETQAESSQGLAAGRAQSFTALSREIDRLTTTLAAEVAAEFGGQVTADGTSVGAGMRKRMHGRSFDTRADIRYTSTLQSCCSVSTAPLQTRTNCLFPAMETRVLLQWL